MHKFLSFNHKITFSTRRHLLTVSPAIFYGRGIFTTIAVYREKPFQWEKHWRRLTENAQAAGIDLSDFPEKKVLSSLVEIITRNSVQNGRVRVTFFDESAAGIWKTNTRRKTSLLITSAHFRSVSNSLRLNFSPFPVNSKSPLAGVKSCNYLENILALGNARNQGFDEAIRLNEKNEIVSAVMANVFWVRNKKIFTTVLESGALRGTTRDWVLQNFPVEEKRALPDELGKADEIFLTSAGIGIARVESIDKRIFSEADTVLKIQNFFNKMTC